MSDIWLITGGGRSGKSAYAEGLASEKGNVLYIATGVACDEEMVERIARHRRDRPENWITWERHCDFGDIENEFDADKFDMIMVDCLGCLLMGILYEEVPDEDDFSIEDFEHIEELATADVDVLCDYAVKYDKRLVFVTNEIGMGLIPETRYSRYFRDILGRLNSYAAKKADTALLMVAGIPVKLK